MQATNPESGALVSESGIYEALRHEHQFKVALISGQEFPECRFCSGRVQFTLIESAPYAYDDPDFSK